MSNWKAYKVNLLQTIPNQAGVYAIYHSNELVFIGQSEFLRDRLRYHELLGPRYRAVSRLKVKICKKPGDFLRLEFLLVRRLKPRLNHTKDKYNKDHKPLATPEVIAFILNSMDQGVPRYEVSKTLNRKKLTDSMGRVWTAVSVGNVWKHLKNMPVSKNISVVAK